MERRTGMENRIRPAVRIAIPLAGLGLAFGLAVAGFQPVRSQIYPDGTPIVRDLGTIPGAVVITGNDPGNGNGPKAVLCGGDPPIIHH
jgi:hypothetical protein